MHFGIQPVSFVARHSASDDEERVLRDGSPTADPLPHRSDRWRAVDQSEPKPVWWRDHLLSVSRESTPRFGLTWRPFFESRPRMNSATPAPHLPEPVFLNSEEVAARLGITLDSLVWLRRKRKISFIRMAGNRNVRFWWPQVVEDLRRLEIKAIGRMD